MNVKVKIIDKHTLELLSDANIGDRIDLNDINIIDFDLINEKINNHFEDRLKETIENTKAKTLLEVQEQINKYNSQITILNKEKEDIKSIVLNEEKSKNQIDLLNIENSYKLKETSLNNKINLLENEVKEIELKTKEKLTNELLKEINLLKEDNLKKLEKIEQEKNSLLLKEANLNNEINLLKQEKINFEQIAKSNLEAELTKKTSELSLKFKEDLLEKDKEISNLINQRAVKNIKQTGEDLEAWCDSEIKNYMQNGLLNCSWNKDNSVVRNEDESKGSKADFIFDIYSDEQKSVLLTNICLEMKDENPDSVNRKKNEDHFKQLDKNRTKKGCKYALLVSNLELDKPNDLPIYRVLEYPDMYVVRPGYLMTFLNMIVSLSLKFKDLILNVEKERIEFKSSTDLLEEFESLKKTYLDKPLDLLEKELTSIKTASNAIIVSAEKINVHCENIKIKYIEEIENKLSRFNITKLNKKIEKSE
ncbi:MAG: DUF2130 domain-containing protein [bacterium]